MAPGHGGVERPLAVGGVAHARPGNGSLGCQAVADDVGEVPDPRGGELDPSRQVVEEAHPRRRRFVRQAANRRGSRPFRKIVTAEPVTTG